MDKNILKIFFDGMETKKYPINAIFVFVYNDYNTYSDDEPHLEECFDNEEVHEIIDSVCDLFDETIALGSENAFIEWCSSQRPSNKKVYVYTMAQYVDGFGRRTLIPALCQYYGFININADAYMSALGCNKQTMYNLLAVNSFSDILAPTIFLNHIEDINCEEINSKLGNDIILKPINESCCIDTIVLKKFTDSELITYATQLLKKYGHAMVQKYISGQEIGITTVCYNNEIYTLTPMQIIFPSGKTYLTHTDSFYGNYQLEACKVPSELLTSCKKMSAALEFYCTTRYDFRYDGKKYYLFDLSPNPTVNGYSSSNFAARATLQCDHRGILRLMAYTKISLFEPSLD